MSTFILKSQTGKSRNEAAFRIESYREKVPLLLYQQNRPGNKNEEPFKTHHLHLPNIHQTQNLLTAKLQIKTAGSDKENDYCMPKLFKKEVELHRRKLQNSKRLATDEKSNEKSRQKEEGQHVYHNFISKKKNKKKVHMSKIIEKVLSEDIEPWALGPNKPNCKPSKDYIFQFGLCREESYEIFEREKLKGNSYTQPEKHARNY